MSSTNIKLLMSLSIGAQAKSISVSKLCTCSDCTLNFVCVVTVGLAIGNVKFTWVLHEWELTYQRCMVSVPGTFIMPSFLSAM